MKVVKYSELGATSPADFDAMVHAFAKEVLTHRAHMKKVASGEAQAYPPPVAHPMIAQCLGEDGSVNYQLLDDRPPPPSEAQAAMDTIHRQKLLLVQRVVAEEERVAAKIFPHGRRRLLNIQRNDAIAADAAIRNAAIEEHNERTRAQHAANEKKNKDHIKHIRAISDEYRKTLQKFIDDEGKPSRTKKGRAPPELVIPEAPEIAPAPTLGEQDLRDLVAAKRAPHHATALKAFDDIERRIHATVRHSAELQAEIEDLAPDKIDTWKMRPFPED